MGNLSTNTTQQTKEQQNRTDPTLPPNAPDDFEYKISNIEQKPKSKYLYGQDVKLKIEFINNNNTVTRHPRIILLSRKYTRFSLPTHIDVDDERYEEEREKCRQSDLEKKQFEPAVIFREGHFISPATEAKYKKHIEADEIPGFSWDKVALITKISGADELDEDDLMAKKEVENWKRLESMMYGSF